MNEIIKIILNCIFTTIGTGFFVTLTFKIFVEDEKVSLFYLFIGGLIGAVVFWNIFNLLIKHLEKYLMNRKH
jgi:hypothetical protein